MPASVVQSRSAQGAGVASVALAFSSNVTAGNGLVVGSSCFLLPSPTCSTSPTNTWTRDVNRSSPSTQNTASIFSAPNAAGGATTVTLGGGTGSSYPTIMIHEVAGLLSSAILDQSTTNNGGSTPLTTGTTSATTQADEIAFGVISPDSGTGTPTANNGFTVTQSQDSSTAEPGATAYKILNATGTQTVTFTWTNVEYAAVIATYKATSGGGATILLLNQMPNTLVRM